MNDLAAEPIAWWKSFLEGDKDALSALYRFYFPVLYEYGVRLHQREELVKDCIQDLFIKLWTNRHNLQAAHDPRRYLLIALRGAIYNKLKQAGNHKVVPYEQHHDFRLTFSAESAYIKKEAASLQSQQLLNALEKMSPRQKEIIYLRFYEEMEYEDISAVMGITVKAAYKLYARALEALKDILHISLPALLVLLSQHKG